MEIVKILFDVDNFQSLIPQDDALAESGFFALDGRPIKASWTDSLRATIDGVELPVPDIFSLSGSPVLYGKSLELLADLVAGVGEFLPIGWDAVSGFLVNFTKTIDCLDRDRTEWFEHRATGKRLFIKKYAFVARNIPNTLPFRIPEEPFSLFCKRDESDGSNFVELVCSSSITGLRFDTVG